ncbi:hypothetical protein L107_11940 [Cyanobium sp. Copco_Reservoir_LC18]|nr:hypothetical protein L107_11940 [Cyanobium sp. Copco_Reservoir_LC18]
MPVEAMADVSARAPLGGLRRLVPPLAVLTLAMAAAAPAALAQEPGGRTQFLRAPWKVTLTSYTTNVGQSPAEYFFTLSLEAGAGASLGGMTIQQIRGADWQFPFAVERTRAFLGVPRREGPRIPVQAGFDPAARRFDLSFPEPVPPGATVTVSLRPWTNPVQADTYLFQVTAIPAGPGPVPSPVGVGTLRIYQPNEW